MKAFLQWSSMYKCMSKNELRCYMLEDIVTLQSVSNLGSHILEVKAMSNDKRQFQAMRGPCKQLAKLELHPRVQVLFTFPTY